MRNGHISDYQAQHWLDVLSSVGLWYAAMSADPTVVGDPLAVEVVGGSYARVEGVFVRSGRSMLSDTPMVIVVPGGSTVTGIALFDAAFNGNMRAYSPLPEGPQSFQSGGTVIIAAGDFAVTIDP